MENKVEQQRDHFNRIAEKYFEARNDSNHLLIKDLIWGHFLGRISSSLAEIKRVLEPMCGMAEGYEILRRHLGGNFTYAGFDYSDRMVEIARKSHPDLDIWCGDATKFEDRGESYDLIILIGGLHHVYSLSEDVIGRLRLSLRPGGYFISLEPTHDNWLWRRVRERVYQANSLFDNDTEQGFAYQALELQFRKSGFRCVDQVFPGLLAYVLFYNPDAFPSLNVGGPGLVRFCFWIDRLIWSTWLGRKLSFATLSLWFRDR